MSCGKSSACGRGQYTDVTETPDVRASKEQLDRLYTRYKFAARYCSNKDVLEVACGSGIGLGYLARRANRIVGGDIDETNLSYARSTYSHRSNIAIEHLDAQKLPFRDSSFDVLIFYEAIYYLADPDRFISEAKRVLKKGGTLIIGTVNKDWADFNPSPHSHRYFSVPELYALLSQDNLTDIVFYGDSPVVTDSVRRRAISLVKRAAVRFNLMPSTMKGKEFLKRIFMGELVPLPAEIKDGMATYTEPMPIELNVPNRGHKVIISIAVKA